MKRYIFATIFLLMALSCIKGQQVYQASSSEIFHNIQKLNRLISVLYIAAHPDDENTKLLSYFANEVKAETAYLSLTRGGGGQNLIGKEIGSLLGVLRTQELLEARKVDGAGQFFSRAIDFGYSKHSDETFEVWEKDNILRDVVTIIRNFQPDVIINRFDHRTPGKTHGHHTASAILSVEAFHKAAAPEFCPEILPIFQPQRIFFNTSWWFYGGKDKFKNADKSRLFSIDVGGYDPLKGISYTEIADMARSQHRCQGFGRKSTRGSTMEWLEWIDGDRPTDKNDILEGINSSWTRINGGLIVQKAISKLEKSFDFSAPYKSVDQLIEIYGMINRLPNNIWKSRKLQECKELILQCSALHLEATTDMNYACSMDTVPYVIEAINRSPLPWSLKGVYLNQEKLGLDMTNKILPYNEPLLMYESLVMGEEELVSTPYWLLESPSNGKYIISDDRYDGNPESQEPMNFIFDLQYKNFSLSLSRPLHKKIGDPVHGEVREPFEVVDPISINPLSEVLLFDPGESKRIAIEIEAMTGDISGSLVLNMPSNWKAKMDKKDFEIGKKNNKQILYFDIIAPENETIDFMSVEAHIGNEKYRCALHTISYDHIQDQYVSLPNKVKLISSDINIGNQRIAYIMGAGDKIPESLKNLGFHIETLQTSDITHDRLKDYDVMIMGVRLYNTNDQIANLQNTIFEYVHSGGTLICQYNTAHRLKTKNFAPYPIQLSRKRVCREEAEIRILNADHPLLNFPNKISSTDFENWVQERGLYFPDQWDDRYTTILSSNDEEEESLDGGILVSDYGKGKYIYTSYSFFRQLPAGVPGAIKLYANLIASNDPNLKTYEED